MLNVIEKIDLPQKLGYVELIDSSKANLNEEERINFITSIAAISRGKDFSKNPKKRFEHLLKEGAPNSIEETKEKKLYASRVLQFCPVYLKELTMKPNEFYFYHNNVLRFSYIDNTGIYTNFRALYNVGLDIPFNTSEEVKDFVVLKIKAPHFVFDQIYTHSMLSKVAVSERVVKEIDYWLPTDFMERFNKWYSREKDSYFKELYGLDYEEAKNWIFKNCSTEAFYNLMKNLMYPREIYQRFHYGLKYKEWFMAGWKNDSATWEHLCLQRSAFPQYYIDWTQEQTKLVVEGIKNLIFKEI